MVIKKKEMSHEDMVKNEVNKFVKSVTGEKLDDKIIEKTLSNVSNDSLKKNCADVVIIGDDLFKLLCKAYSKNEGWMKSTKAMQVHGGCVVQTTTQQQNNDGSYSVSDSLVFVPGVKIVDDIKGGRKLVKI